MGYRIGLDREKRSIIYILFLLVKYQSVTLTHGHTNHTHTQSIHTLHTVFGSPGHALLLIDKLSIFKYFIIILFFLMEFIV